MLRDWNTGFRMGSPQPDSARRALNVCMAVAKLRERMISALFFHTEGIGVSSAKAQNAVNPEFCKNRNMHRFSFRHDEGISCRILGELLWSWAAFENVCVAPLCAHFQKPPKGKRACQKLQLILSSSLTFQKVILTFGAAILTCNLFGK